jgi:type IV pilus assembly protein PilQ
MWPIQPSEEISKPSYEMGEETTEEQQTTDKNVAESPEEPQPLKLAVVEEEVIPRYIGAHISLDFKDADIRNILRLIAEVSNLNIVAGDDVKGTVTIRLTDVPWDQALDVILLSLNLGKTLEGNILRVAPIERLNREKLAAINVRQTEEQLEPLKIVLIPVSYADAYELKELIRALGRQKKR